MSKKYEYTELEERGLGYGDLGWFIGSFPNETKISGVGNRLSVLNTVGQEGWQVVSHSFNGSNRFILMREVVE